MVFPKNLIAILVSFSIFSSPIIGAQQIAEDYSTGKARIERIMGDTKLGVAAYNKQHVAYAETQNISRDLHINEIASFFGCKTVIGHSYLVETLQVPVHPTHKDSVLTRRQQAVRTLVDNPALLTQLRELIDQAAMYEQDIVKLMSEFFVGKTCPELAQLELIKKQSPTLYPMFAFLHLNPTGKIINTSLLTTSTVGVTAAIGVFGHRAYQAAQAGQDYTRLAMYTGYFGLINAFYIYTLYKDYSSASEKRQKMHALNQLINTAEKVEALCANHGLETHFSIGAIQNREGKELIDQLKHPRYQEKNTLFFATPMVHSLLYKLYQQDKQLAQLFACIAELDVYTALASKIVESQAAQNKLCFVRFLDNATPTIQARSFWSVIVPHAVPSSLSEDRHVILTGPNAGGKTTTIKALLQNIILGQSFGIAAAEQFDFTPFDVIHSYLNVSDDLVQGLSLFASEVKRAQDILQRIKTLENSQKFFFALDELFTGTVAEDGETCAYNFVQRIAGMPGIQFIYANHFEKLKQLAHETKTCVNYKVDAPIKNDAGKLVYPFTLSQGASDARVALDIAREANLFA